MGEEKVTLFVPLAGTVVQSELSSVSGCRHFQPFYVADIWTPAVESSSGPLLAEDIARSGVMTIPHCAGRTERAGSRRRLKICSCP